MPKKRKFNIQEATNSTVRSFWERKKLSLRWKMALFFVALNIIGLEFSAPGFSITTTIAEEIAANSSFLMEIIDKFSQINSKIGFVDLDLYGIAGKSTKLLVITILALFCYYFICNKDPFSNLELLRDISYHGYKKRYFYLKEIVFYAKYLPSNILAEICNNCLDKDECTRKVAIQGEGKTRAWCRLFAKLSPINVEYWHKATYECRKAFYLKYGLLFSVIFLTMVLLFTLFFNKFILTLPLKSTGLIAYIVLILIGYISISLIHGVKKSQGGAWRNFKEKAELYFNSNEFDRFVKNNLCWQITSENEIKDIMTMNNYLGYLIEDKLIRHCIGKNERPPYNKANIRRILQHIKALFYVLYKKDVNFRTAFFLLSEDHKYLFPFILDNTNHSRFHCLTDGKKVHTISADFFSISKDSVAAESWRTKKPISKNNNLKTVLSVSSNHLKSICCYPLVFNDDVYETLRAEHANLPINFGILCVDCDDEAVFSEKNNKLNTLLIKPFSERIIYELSLGVYYKNKEKK